MSYRPLKHLNEGAFKELLTSEEDYLAYRAGVHLSKMTTSDLSALSTNAAGELVGTFEDTFYTSGLGPIPGSTITRTIAITHASDPAGSTHTSTFGAFTPLPTVVYVGDTIELTIQGTATNTGIGFEEIEYQLGISGSAAIGTITTTPSPAATSTSANGREVSWENYPDGNLSGSYQVTWSIPITDDGVINFTLNGTTTDFQNSVVSSTDAEVLPSVRVEPQLKPTTSATLYELYQNDANVATIDNDNALKRNPLYWDRTATPAGLKEMSDAELDIVVQRLLLKIFANDLPGQYRLATVSPGAQWSEFIADVFEDTRGDGSLVTYSIWVKTTATVPTVVKPISPLRQPLTNKFQGIKDLNDLELEMTFGERMKQVIQDTGIGKYQLRSSADGPPTDPGTWEARGSAIDTNLTYESETAYISTDSYDINYASQYQGSYVPDYIGEYIDTYESNYLGEYGATYTSSYTGNYEATYIGTFSGDYAQSYIGDYLLEYAQSYESGYEGEYVPNYSGLTVEEQYTTIYEAEDAIEFYASAYAELYGDLPVIYTGNYVTQYVEEVYTGNFTEL